MLETERLRLRMLDANDFDAYAKMHADAEVMRYLGTDGRPLSRAEAWRHLAMMLGHWQLLRYGPWAVEEKATGALVGRVGFYIPDGWPGFEIGWTLAREHWGRGYAIEAARRALRFAFEELDRPHVISVIHPENVRSIAVAERLGETFERRETLNGVDYVIYGIDRPAPPSS